MNIKEIQKLIKYTVLNNITLSKAGKSPVSLNIIGESGIGKTDSIREVCATMDIPFLEVDLSGREDVGDLLGLPIEKYEVCLPNSDCEWVPSTLIDYYHNKGYIFTGRSRMEYSIPQSMMIDPSRPMVLYLDDYSRATPSILQAAMTLLKDGKINNWILPKGSTVICSSNPDDGEYHVTAVDNAHSTRNIRVNAEFDLNIWLENYGLTNVDERGVNFLLNFKDELKFKSEGNAVGVNIRLWTMFFDQLSGLTDWDKDLVMIKNLMTEDQFGKEYPLLFTKFVSGKLDKLPSIEYIFNEDITKIDDLFKEITKSRLDVVNILKERITFFCMSLTKEDSNFEKYCNRLKELLNLTHIFPNDHLWTMITTLGGNKDIPMAPLNEQYNRIAKINKAEDKKK